MSMSAQEWFRSRECERRVQDREYVERQQERLARKKTRRRDWTDLGGSVDQAISRESGGYFLAPESGNRGEKGVMASLAFMPEVADEEKRLVAGDKLRRCVSTEELEDRSSESETDIVEDGVDEDGYPDFAFTSVDLLAAPKFIRFKGTIDGALTELFRKSPKYVIEAYHMADRTGRLDVLNHLPGAVAELVKEGSYSIQAFQETPAGNGFSVYKTLKGHASTERSVLGDNTGVACQILKVLQAGQMQVSA